MDKNLKTALVIGGVVVAVIITLSVVFGLLGRDSGYGMMGGFGGGWLMAVGMVVFWGLVIWGIVALVRGASTSGPGSSAPPDSALEILRKRYARGEINKQEYEEKKKDLV